MQCDLVPDSGAGYVLTVNGQSAILAVCTAIADHNHALHLGPQAVAANTYQLQAKEDATQAVPVAQKQHMLAQHPSIACQSAVTACDCAVWQAARPAGCHGTCL